MALAENCGFCSNALRFIGSHMTDAIIKFLCDTKPGNSPTMHTLCMVQETNIYIGVLEHYCIIRVHHH